MSCTSPAGDAWLDRAATRGPMPPGFPPGWAASYGWEGGSAVQARPVEERRGGIVAPELRRLGEKDLEGIEQHLLALDVIDRHARFGAVRSDALLTAYARRLDPIGAVLFGAVDGLTGRIVGFSEAQPTADPRRVELAVSVHWLNRRCGLGQLLVGAAVTAAFACGADVAEFFFASDNRAFAGLARAIGARIGPTLDRAELRCPASGQDRTPAPPMAPGTDAPATGRS